MHGPTGGHISGCYSETNQELYIVAKSSLHELVEVAGAHAKYCSQKLVFSKVNHRGHVAVGRLTCGKDKEHQYWWSSSPKLPTGAYFVSDRVQHAVFCSGMLPVHYKWFADGAGIGHVTAKQQRKHFAEYKPLLRLNVPVLQRKHCIERLVSMTLTGLGRGLIL